jgi:tetratricopeptide (TPR) repeat protein
MIKDNLARAARLHASGNLLSARREAEAALAAEPENIQALRFAGVLSCQSGDPQRGADLLRKALSREPRDEPTRLNLIQALVDSGQLADAETVGLEAGKSNNPQMLRARAAVARQIGKSEEAVSLLERAVAQAPNDWAAWNNFGNALNEAEQAERAVKAFERARALNPGAAIVHLNMGRALGSADRHEESLRAFHEAARLDPEDGMAAFEVGKCLLRLGRPEEALPILSKAARICRTNANVFLVIGLTYARLQDLKQAEQSYRVALHVDPAHPAAYLNLSILLERGNRMDEVESLYEQAVKNGVAEEDLSYVKALILRRKGALTEALELARQSTMTSLDPAWRAQLIGEVADKLHDADTAFAAYSEMNELAASKPDAVQFDRTAYWQRIEAMTKETTREWFDSWRPVEPANVPPSPAFLAGFLRSGTTLLDTILMGHPETQVIEEEPMLAAVEDALGDWARLGELDTPAINSLRERYYADVRHPAPPGKLLIDKNPLATLRAPIIYRLFPDAPFIFTVRHPCDVVLSCFMQNFLVTESTASFLDLENAARAYDRTMTFWQKSRDIFPLRVHTIRYEDMVEDLEGELRPLLDFLGLEWDERILDHRRTASERGYIRTPSYAQVTEQIYSRASGRWMRYRKHMEDVLPILEPWVEKFGYSLD